MNIFADIGISILFAAVFGLVARALKQPIILGYIAAGLLLGPGLSWVTDQSIIFTLSEIGTAFLLFIVGLEIDLKKIKDIGRVAGLGGVIQICLLFMIGFVLSTFFGFTVMEAMYLGIILAFSSTMLVVKLLSDRKELETLHSRIIIGFLIVEDIAAIIALTILGTLNTFSVNILLISLTKSAMLLLLCITLAHFVLPPLFSFAAKNLDLLFLLAVSTCLGYAILFSLFGFSIAFGAFVAGVSLASLPWNFEIIARVRSLRDFFATLFFVALGLRLSFLTTSSILLPLIVFTLVILFIKPVINQSIVQFFGYKRKTALHTAICLTQISEFSLIIASMGISYGHIGQSIYSLAVLLAIITMTTSSYVINYRSVVFGKIERLFPHMDRLTAPTDDLAFGETPAKKHIILCGYNRAGYHILDCLRKLHQPVFVVDYNPQAIRRLVELKQPCLYGDITDDEITERANMEHARMVISTAHDLGDNLTLLKLTKKCNRNIPVIVTANQVKDALHLYEAGADYVILPHLLGGNHLSSMLEKLHIDNIVKLKNPHIRELKYHHLNNPDM